MELSERTYGVEIECTVPTEALMREGWVVGGHYRGREIPGFPGWKASSDGSLRAEFGFTAVEMVSPVMRGMDGLNQITAMAAKLNEMGAKVGGRTNAGFHVHVGWAEDAQALVRLIYLTANVETGLFAATGSRGRASNHYCKSIKAGFIGVTSAGAIRTPSELAQKVEGTTDRYHALNLSNILRSTPGKQTVEFRLFAGTTNATKMRAYVQLALGLVQLAIEWPKKAKWHVAPRPYLFRGLPGEAEVKRLFVVLGWSKNASLSYGPHRKDETFKAFGLLDEANLPAMKKLLVQLGKKFDGGPRRDPNVEVE